MRHLAIGDIHGCYRSLTSLADFVEFRPDDVIITLGDYVDRGLDSCAVLDWLIFYSERATLIALRGNHEIMMLKARENSKDYKEWLAKGNALTDLIAGLFPGLPHDATRFMSCWPT